MAGANWILAVGYLHIQQDVRAGRRGQVERSGRVKFEKSYAARQGLKSFLALAAVCTTPFVVVGLLSVDFLSVWRMAAAYAIAVFSRQGFRLAIDANRKALSVVAACLMLAGVGICATYVAWRPEHRAICGCGLPLDYNVPARLYFGPVVWAVILIAAALCCEHGAFRGKRGIVAKFIFYAACVGIACFALNFVDELC